MKQLAKTLLRKETSKKEKSIKRMAINISKRDNMTELSTSTRKLL